MSPGESAKLLRESEREACRTEVRRLHACNRSVGKFECPLDFSVMRACTASRIAKVQTVETGHPRGEDERGLIIFPGLPDSGLRYLTLI